MSRPIETISDTERLARLRLIRSENVGPITYHQIIAHFGSAEAALDALPDMAKRGGRGRAIKICPRGDAERELAALDALDGTMIALGEPAYPAALAALEDAPAVITVKGQRALLSRPAVAIVGARNASANGRRLATTFAAALGEAGFAVVSGMARGIDTAAHQGALEAGTIAVLAGGLDVIYPQENQALYETIGARGLVVTEMPPGTVPKAQHFPRRNRLISGLSLGVVVVEAALRSGSLITARFALEQGREVFAVPGSPLDPRARGCNRLLRDGASWAEGPDDVIQGLNAMVAQPKARIPQTFKGLEAGDPPAVRDVNSARDLIEGLLSTSPVTVDELMRQCQLSPSAVQVALLELELAGRLERHPGNRVALAA